MTEQKALLCAILFFYVLTFGMCIMGTIQNVILNYTVPPSSIYRIMSHGGIAAIVIGFYNVLRE